jgi:hypothetical protein
MKYITKNFDSYFSGIGIGHKLNNWLTGYVLAKKMDIPYAYSAFPTTKTEYKYNVNADWEDFFSLGKNEVWIDNLLNQGYEYYQLPLFDGNIYTEIDKIKKNYIKP